MRQDRHVTVYELRLMSSTILQASVVMKNAISAILIVNIKLPKSRYHCASGLFTKELAHLVIYITCMLMKKEKTYV